MAEKNNVVEQIREKIAEAENILVALSRDPSVDEMAGAIGLTMALDKMGKHATAIYSGETPNALEFLEPEKTFEADTNSLQDFIIALNKEKADHLRYKIEGDYVRVYITPYKTEISEKDLEFSHGDFNVDLVIALDIDDVSNLDAALSEYGRIMHDATAVNITTGVAGNFAETEWSDPEKSSVCEMLVELLNGIKSGRKGEDEDDAKAEASGAPGADISGAGVKMTKEVATALLTGIVAETDRFSNNRTMPETMNVAAELMKAGADQKLIADNIELGEEKKAEPEPEQKPEEPAPEIKTEPVMEVKHEEEVEAEAPEQTEEQKSATEQLEQMIQAPSEEETAMEQLRQVANEVELPKFEPGQNPAEVIAPEMTEKEANGIPEMNFGGGEVKLEPASENKGEQPTITGDVVNIVPPSEQSKSEVELPPVAEEPVPVGGEPVISGAEPKEEMPVTKLEEIELPPPPAPPMPPELMAEAGGEPELPKIEIKEDATLSEEESLVDPSAFKIPNVGSE